MTKKCMIKNLNLKRPHNIEYIRHIILINQIRFEHKNNTKPNNLVTLILEKYIFCK